MEMLNTVANVGVVLDLFSRERPEWGVTELSRATGLPKSNVHALVGSLVEIGLLTRTPRKRYRLGWHLLVLSDRMLSGSGLREHALPEMQRLAEELRETVFLAVARHDRVLYIERVEGLHPIVRLAGQRVGTELPLYCTAVGKVFLAEMEREEAMELLKHHEFKARTAHTIASAEELLEGLDRVRRDGIAYDRRELSADACCVAAPLRDVGRHVVAALSVSMPAYRFEPTIANVTARLLESAERVSSLMADGERARSVKLAVA